VSVKRDRKIHTGTNTNRPSRFDGSTSLTMSGMKSGCYPFILSTVEGWVIFNIPV